MDREQLVRLLDRDGAAFAACRAAVLTGAEIVVPGEAMAADQVAAIYARRERHLRRTGTPTVGFAAAVKALRSLGSEPIRLGAVKVSDTPYHFQLFFDEGAWAVVACLGVKQGRRLEPGDRALLIAEAVALVRADFPGWVQVAFTDATGHRWTVVDKVPVFTEESISAKSPFPVPVVIRCIVIAMSSTELGEPSQVTVSIAVDAVDALGGVDEFCVFADQLRDVVSAGGGGARPAEGAV